MDHSDDQSDFAPDDDLLMQQEIMLLKIKAYSDSSITDDEFQKDEKAIRKKYAYKHLGDDF